MVAPGRSTEQCDPDLQGTLLQHRQSQTRAGSQRAGAVGRASLTLPGSHVGKCTDSLKLITSNLEVTHTCVHSREDIWIPQHVHSQVRWMRCYFSSHTMNMGPFHDLCTVPHFPHFCAFCWWFFCSEWGFCTDGSVGKESTCNSENTGDAGLILGLGRCPGEGNGTPLQNSCLENSMGREAWQATVQGAAKSWTWLRTKHTFQFRIALRTALRSCLVFLRARSPWCAMGRKCIVG